MKYTERLKRKMLVRLKSEPNIKRLMEVEMHCFMWPCRGSNSTSVCYSNDLLQRAALTGLAVSLANEQEKLSGGSDLTCCYEKL